MGQRLYKRGDSPNWYVNLGGVYRSTGCRDKRAAEARAGELERARHSPQPAPNAPTLAVALARALTDRAQRGRSTGTLHMYGIKIGHLARVIGDETRLDAIGAAEVDRYTGVRLNEGAARNTIAKELGVLAVTLKMHRRRGEYPHDPAAVMPQGWAAEYKPRTRYLTPDEAMRLLRDLIDTSLPQRRRDMSNRAARVAFILATSARWSESDRARVADIGQTEVVLHGTKTAEAARTVPVLPSTATLLDFALEHGNESGLLFEPWPRVNADLRRACARLGIPPVSPNDLRRTTATWLRAAGVEPHLIASVLGHRDSRMVEKVYGRMPPDALRAALLARTPKVSLMLPMGTKRPRKAARRMG